MTSLLKYFLQKFRSGKKQNFSLDIPSGSVHPRNVHFGVVLAVGGGVADLADVHLSPGLHVHANVHQVPSLFVAYKKKEI